MSRKFILNFLPFYRYTVSVVPFIWKELQNLLNTTKVLQCDSKDSKDKDPFFMKVSVLVQFEFDKRFE